MVMDRYLTKICDQVVALLSTTHTASFKLVWGDEESDSGSIDIDGDDEDRLFRYEVARRIEQEECAALRSGFKVILSPIIPDCTADLFKGGVTIYFGLRASCRLSCELVDIRSKPPSRGNCSRILEGFLHSAANSHHLAQSTSVQQGIPKAAAVGTLYICESQPECS